MKKFTAILLTVIMVASLFISCNNSIAPTVTDETVSVSFTEATSRSLTVSLEEFNKGDYYWKYAARKNTADSTGLNSGATASYNERGALWIYGGSANTPTDDGLGSVAGFSQGIWDFKLFAYKLVDTNYNLAYQGEVTGVSLKKGSANTVSVTVSPVDGDKGTLVLDNSISLTPAKSTNKPTGLTKVYTVTELGDTSAISPDNGTNTWTLDAGAYKVNVDFVKDGFTYASGSVVATVYSNIQTTVRGDLAELVTKAEFDSSINPDVMNKEASSESVDLGTLTQEGASDVTLMDGEEETTSKVVATVPAAAAAQIINTVAGNEAPANTTVELALRVDTVSATNTTLELEIGMQATVTKTENNKITQTTHKVSELKDSTGASKISVVTIKLQPGLRNVYVYHNNSETPMNKLTSAEENAEGIFYNDITGVLTIKTSSFSPFTVTYDAPEYVAKIGNVSYTTLQGAVDASVAGDTIILQDDVVLSESLVISGGKELTIDLNGFDISAPSGVIKIVHANVTLTGTGTIYELNDDQYGAICLSGAATDKGANYSVVTVDENVTLRGWSGIFVARDEARTYKNYGIVANIKGNIVLPGMNTHEARDGAGIYINGQNNNTDGNVPVFNLDGAEISGNSGIYAAGYAKWNFENVTIEADSEALSIKAGEFVIDGGTYKAKGEFHDPSIDNSNGSVSTGAALSMTSNEGYAHKVDVTVNDGKLISLNGYAVFEGIPYDEKEPSKLVAPESYVTLRINGGEFVGNAEKGAIKLSKIKQPKVITGGTFSSDPSEYLARGYNVNEENGRYVVYAGTIVCTVEELQAAMHPEVNDGVAVISLANDLELQEEETWTSLNMEAYGNNVHRIVINGNGHKIKGLNAALINRAYFGNTSIEIKDLTLVNSNINNTDGGWENGNTGAFIGFADSCKSVSFTNCHVKDSVIKGLTSSGGLIGYCSSPLTIENCSVINSRITGEDAGALAGVFSVGGDDVANTVNKVSVKDNTIVSIKSGTYRVGELVGTSNRLVVNLSEITTSGNTCTQTGSTGATERFTSTKWFGRRNNTVIGDDSEVIVFSPNN